MKKVVPSSFNHRHFYGLRPSLRRVEEAERVLAFLPKFHVYGLTISGLAHLDRANIPRSLKYLSTTLGRILDQSVDRFGDTEALLYNHHRWTYRELLADVNRMAGGLVRLGSRQMCVWHTLWRTIRG